MVGLFTMTVFKLTTCMASRRSRLLDKNTRPAFHPDRRALLGRGHREISRLGDDPGHRPGLRPKAGPRIRRKGVRCHRGGALYLDRKMLAVVAKADQAELFNILRTLFHSMTEGDAPDLEAVPPVWAQIERFELDEPFWRMVETVFGYGEESPTEEPAYPAAGLRLRSLPCQGTTRCAPGPSIATFRSRQCGGLPSAMERQQRQG